MTLQSLIFSVLHSVPFLNRQISIWTNKAVLIFCLTVYANNLTAQPIVNLSEFKKGTAVNVTVADKLIDLTWPAGAAGNGKLQIDMESGKPLFKSIGIVTNTGFKEIGSGLDPAYLLRIGKRTLDPKSGGWDIFFDKVPTRPYKSYQVELDKRSADVVSSGSQTVIRIS